MTPLAEDIGCRASGFSGVVALTCAAHRRLNSAVHAAIVLVLYPENPVLRGLRIQAQGEASGVASHEEKSRLKVP